MQSLFHFHANSEKWQVANQLTNRAVVDDILIPNGSGPSLAAGGLNRPMLAPMRSSPQVSLQVSWGALGLFLLLEKYLSNLTKKTRHHYPKSWIPSMLWSRDFHVNCLILKIRILPMSPCGRNNWQRKEENGSNPFLSVCSAISHNRVAV